MERFSFCANLEPLGHWPTAWDS